MKKILTISAAALFIVTSCGKKAETAAPEETAPAVNLIFETDMGNDVDDALALDMIYKYIENGDVKLLGISTNKRGEASPEYIGIMGKWYGHEVPIGQVVDGVPCDHAANYAQAVCDLKAEDGTPMFERSEVAVMPSVELYRKLLAAQPDSSVTIASVGFSTNLANLLDSPADENSPLTGKELIAQKVKLLVLMAGTFTQPWSEYNVKCDIPAAIKVVDEWPTEIVTSPWELGEQIKYPGKSIEEDFAWAKPAHPMVEGYKAYMPMPYDRQTWDLTSVMYAIEGPEGFTMSAPGTIKIDENGVSTFVEDPEGRHSYMMVDSIQAAAILDRMVKIITRRPAKYADLAE